MTSTSTGAPSAHPSLMTDRRAFLATAPALALLTAGPAALARPAQASGIDHAIAVYREAAARAAAFDNAVFSPAHDKWEALCRAIPHYTTKAGFEVRPGEIMHLRSDRSTDVAVARDFIRKPYDPGGSVFGECVAELAQAVGERDARVVNYKQGLRIDELEAEYDRLADASAEALNAVEGYPVRTLADLIKKIEVIEETDGAVPPGSLIADLRCIKGEA